MALLAARAVTTTNCRLRCGALEAYIHVAHINDLSTITPVPFAAGSTMTRSADLDWFGTVRGRLGIAFWDRALI